MSFLAGLLFAVHAAASSPWSVMAKSDLHAIHDILRDNHPGAVDRANPHFREWLERGLARSLRDAATARTYGDYVRALRRYTNGFEDGHVTLSFDIAPAQTDWPGFIVRGGAGSRLEVAYAEPDAGVKVGDSIDRCDGLSIDALLKERVDPYFWNRAIPHARENFAAYMFVENPDEQKRRLTTCVASGRDVHLNWRSTDSSEFNKLLGRVYIGDAEFGIREVDGIWFVRLPRFWFKSDAEMQKLSGVIAEIAKNAAELRKSTVVFDVRGNGGGDSLWGYRIAVALWREDWPNRIEASFDPAHEIRVSPANMKKVEEIVERMKKNGETEALPYWQSVLDAMRGARSAGRPLAPVVLEVPPPSGDAPPNPITGRVFLLTDSACGSACLDFADLVLRLPGTTQIGSPTFADTVYIDSNDLALPSGIAHLSYGMKVFRHRVRKNNEWYEPKYRLPENTRTEEAIAAWIRSLPAYTPQ